MNKWNNDDINKAILLHNNGLKFREIGIELNRTTKSIKEKLNKLNICENKSVSYEKKKCLNCDSEFTSLISENRRFCSHSCSSIFNNSKRPKKEKTIKKRIRIRKIIKNNKCLNCGNDTKNKFCTQKCQHEYKRNEIFIKIENGDTSFYHKQYKAYLIYKYGEKCMKCGWNKINYLSNKVPIELEHKDGNSENNNLNNLELLCPNCHSLTPTYKALNKGNGRHNRMIRYNNGKSY
jgi:predicted nucleic acid-binding Zn ribbon protein